MSLGAYTDDDEPPPLARWIEKILGNSVVVAAAGNSGSTRPVYPAVLPYVVAVGALDSRGRAPFSNHGGWVDACVLAVDVVSTFFTHFDETVNGTSRCFRWWARWSGTSFAAPKVAAAIAQDMYLHGGTACGLVPGRLSAHTVSGTPTSALSSTSSDPLRDATHGGHMVRRATMHACDHRRCGVPRRQSLRHRVVDRRARRAATR